jgi:hypothetical protein
MTEAPAVMIYTSVVLQDLVRIALTMAALNDLEVNKQCHERLPDVQRTSMDNSWSQVRWPCRLEGNPRLGALWAQQ